MHATTARRGEWLTRRVGFWGSVGGGAGASFEAYARILHPVDGHRFDLASADEWGMQPVIEEREWSWAEVAERTGRTMHPLVQWQRLCGGTDGVRFDDGWMIGQSPEGWLDPRLCAALTRHLRPATSTPDDITIGIWTGFGHLTGSVGYFSFSTLEDGEDEAARDARLREGEDILRREAEASVRPEHRAAVAATALGGSQDQVLALPGRDYLVLGGGLDELADPSWGYSAGIGWTPTFPPSPTPQLIWPEDHSWVVCSEIDWDSTIVAGPRSLIDAVLADPAFESFEVQETDELMLHSDVINSR
ncbi:hypothetical protein KXS11_11510 [Plantibacter flavus]|uniref:hypothetical protein n=1 Tax=Plantibacter flavus TaxID=150123 RepID=UPI003F17E5E9